MPALRGWIYDRIFAGITASWYMEVLARIPQGGRLLDVGIGTAASLCKNADLIKAKDLSVHGVDIDADYIARAQKTIAKSDLTHRVTAALESVYDHQAKPYTAVYFSCSFMLMPDPVAALRHVMSLLEPERGRIYFTQTFNLRRAPVLERVKPMLKNLTTIDFGQVTYEEQFRAVLAEAELEVLEMSELSRHRNLSYRLVVGRPGA